MSTGVHTTTNRRADRGRGGPAGAPAAIDARADAARAPRPRQAAHRRARGALRALAMRSRAALTLAARRS